MMNPTLCSNPIPDELGKLVHPEQRDIYVGPQMSRQTETRWQDNLQELQVGSMIATLADGDELGHPFWIAKVIALYPRHSRVADARVKEK